jgi:hypothetical protein
MADAVRTATFGAGARVKVKQPMTVPEWSSWDDDHQRTSTSVKKKLQQQFFKADKRIVASVVYITSESVRERLKAKGHVKVEIRDPAGASVVILAEAASLVAMS